MASIVSYTKARIDALLGGKANSSHTHAVGDLTATGTASSSTFLRGDNVWATPPSGGTGGSGTVTAANITDATTVGRAVVTAADQAAARTAIGAGTSNLTLGTTSSTAKAGNYTPAVADVTGLQTALDAKADDSLVEVVKMHDGTTGGGTRPTEYARVRWVGGTVRPTNMAAGDVWEHDA